MMNSMRKYTKKILWVVIAAFVATIFFVWGMDLGQQKANTDQISSAVINGQAISQSEFAQHWEQRYRQLIANSNQDLTAAETQEMRQELMESLIDTTLLKQQADKLKLKVTAQEVASRIGAVPAFQESGKFSQEKYLNMLQYNRITPQEFETEQENAIRMLKMNQWLRESVVVTENDVKDYFQIRSRQIKLQVVGFHWKNFIAGITLPQEELTAYFEAHRSEYDQPEEVRASHILIRVASNANEEEKLTARLKLDNIRNDIVKGASFEELAKKHSEDPGSKDKGGDLGYFGRGMMVEAFDKTVFNLKINELSNIVETPFGFHVIKLISRRDAKKAALAEVQSKIEKTLKEEKAKKLSQDAAVVFMKLLRKVDSLRVVAEQTKMPVLTTGWVKEDSSIPGIDNARTILEQAFDLPAGRPSNSIMAGDGIYFVEIAEEAYQPFDEKLYSLEHDTLLEKLKQLRGDQATQDWLKQARAEAEIVNNVAKEAAEEEITETTPAAQTTPAPVK